MRKHSDEDIIYAVKNSFTYADVCRKLGMIPSGGSYKVVKKYIKDLDLNIDHFTNRATNINNRLNTSVEKDLSFYLTENSNIKTDRLKWKLIKHGIKKYKCECCGLTKWNGKQIKLQLHHINGNPTDNRLENLQFLCPNCHSLTDNYCGGNIKNQSNNKVKYCNGCGRKISDDLILCEDCYDKLINGENINIYEIKDKGICDICGGETSSSKIHICDKCTKEKRHNDFIKRIPSKDELKELIGTLSFIKIASKYKVSDNTIRKWCKFYNIPYRKKDISKNK